MYPKNVYDVDLKLGGGEFSLSACPGVGNRPPRKKGNCKSTAGVCLREGGGGIFTSQFEPCTSTPCNFFSLFVANF